MKAVVVRVRKDIRRADGFRDSALTATPPSLINNPVPSRSARHLRTRPARTARKNHMKIISLAPEVL